MSKPNREKQANPRGPMSGLRVLDLTTVVLGPYATQILGDLGADIIKVEQPEGDTTRHTGPAKNNGMAALFIGINRNKRSVVIDLKTDAGRKALDKLIETSDVLIHNIRPQKLAKLGLSPDALLKTHPRLIYVSINGFRQSGPYAGKPAYDDIIQGACGISSLMAQLTGEPLYAPTIIADKTCGLIAAQAVLAALLHRERTGEGQFVEVPMFEAMVGFVMTEHLYGSTFDPPLSRPGYTRVLAPFRKPYPTANGHICVMAYTNVQWKAFWSAVGREELICDPRFATMKVRSENIEILYDTAGSSLNAQPTEYWLELFDRIGVPAMAVNDLDALLKDPHLAAIDFFRRFDHPTEGTLLLTDSPVVYSRSPANLKRLPPRLGEHSREILEELGLSMAEIAEASGGLSDAVEAAVDFRQRGASEGSK